jgi:apolipoprotein N-acyltransferase
VYLDARNTSYGFQPTAIVYSLPHASFIWAMLLFAIQGFWMTFSGLPMRVFLPVIIPVAVVLSVACLGIWIALHPRKKISEEATVPASVPPPVSFLEKDQATVEAIV